MKQLRGVNLGGWLVLEKWMTPSVFDGSPAPDEYSLCMDLGDAKKQRLKHHRQTFITKKDLEFIADSGFNAIRLPVGHWLFGSHEPYVRTAAYVKKALDWAQAYELAVILDLHTAPGSQNGAVHSGRSGSTGWHLDNQNILQTLAVVTQIAQTYGSHPSVYGIELLNEPDREIPLSLLQNYYRNAYQNVRAYTNCKIIVSDAYRPIAEWQDFIQASEFEDILLDVHLYQLFGEKDRDLNFEEHLAKTLKWKRLIDNFGASKIIVGEWSRAMDQIYEPMDSQTAEHSRKFYQQAQQYAFSSAAGYFYWSYKTENSSDDWNIGSYCEKLNG